MKRFLAFTTTASIVQSFDAENSTGIHMFLSIKNMNYDGNVFYVFQTDAA